MHNAAATESSEYKRRFAEHKRRLAERELIKIQVKIDKTEEVMIKFLL